MNTQALQMRQLVAELIAVVGGSGNGNGHYLAKTKQKPKTREISTVLAKKARRIDAAVRDTKIVNPEIVIPILNQGVEDF